MLGNNNETHLVIEPIIGWRAWDARESGKLFSPSRGDEWPAEGLTAELCPDHPAAEDADDCHCGINAWVSEAELARSAYGRTEVWGEVALTGRVRQFDLGWRGEHGRPRKLWVRDNQPLADAISARYGCPVINFRPQITDADAVPKSWRIAWVATLVVLAGAIMAMPLHIEITRRRWEQIGEAGQLLANSGGVQFSTLTYIGIAIFGVGIAALPLFALAVSMAAAFRRGEVQSMTDTHWSGVFDGRIKRTAAGALFLALLAMSIVTAIDRGYVARGPVVEQVAKTGIPHVSRPGKDRASASGWARGWSGAIPTSAQANRQAQLRASLEGKGAEAGERTDDQASLRIKAGVEPDARCGVWTKADIKNVKEKAGIDGVIACLEGAGTSQAQVRVRTWTAPPADA